MTSRLTARGVGRGRPVDEQEVEDSEEEEKSGDLHMVKVNQEFLESNYGEGEASSIL